MNSTNEQRCPSCNKTALITDDNSGEIVCKSCGLVLSEGSEAAGPEWRSFANDGVDKSRTGTGTSITMHDMGLSTVIGAVNKDVLIWISTFFIIKSFTSDALYLFGG